MSTAVFVIVFVAAMVFLVFAMGFPQRWQRVLSAVIVVGLAGGAAVPVGIAIGGYFEVNGFYNPSGPHEAVGSMLGSIRADMKAKRWGAAEKKVDLLVEGWKTVSIDPRRPEEDPISYRSLKTRVQSAE